MYRTKEEVQEQFDTNDPLKNFKQAVLNSNSLTEKDLEEIETKVEAAIEEAVDFARQSPYPKPTELFEDLYVEGGEAV